MRNMNRKQAAEILIVTNPSHTPWKLIKHPDGYAYPSLGTVELRQYA